MKYSINSSGYIVAERDIYSLGGFIPKGSVGAKVANGDQISQDGECWVASGDMSNRPDIRVKDNAYIGNHFTNVSAVHTDVITEFSGNTLIPGHIVVRCPSADPKCNTFIKDSFIGVTMDVLCGPASTTTAFPFEQGQFRTDGAAGSTFDSIKLANANCVRSTAILRRGRETRIYNPANISLRILWGYFNSSGVATYSGEFQNVDSQGIVTLKHPVYNIAMLYFVSSGAFTPENLLSSGAKILGHISGSLLMDIRPESASGSYVIDNSSFLMNTSNFGLATTQLRFLAGGLFNSTMYTPTDRQDYKPYGTFHDIQRLEYSKYLGDAHRTNVNRDRYISAYDCPLLRVDDNTYNTSLTEKGDLVIRRCIVPKAIFTDNIHNNNLYEDIDFSYANAHLGAKAGNNFDMWSSHKQGEYAAIGAGVAIAGLISRPENLMTGSVVGPNPDSILLDGSMIERGAYVSLIGASYEDAKQNNIKRLRTVRPIRCKGASLPVLSGTWKITSVIYLDENMNIASEPLSGTLPIDETKPFIVFNFGTTNDSEVYVSDFVELNYIIRSYNYGKVPEITGSSFIGVPGGSLTVRGDVQLIGDPYVNRILDRNVWERKALSGNFTNGWEGAKIERVAGDRMLTIDLQEIGDRGCTITCDTGYYFISYLFDGEGNYMLNPGWQRSYVVPSSSLARYAGILIKKATAAADNGGLITEDDIPLANVKIVQAFKKRRYITNELDRTSPEDILLGPDYWWRATVSATAAQVGKYYKDLISSSTIWLILKRLLNAGASWTLTLGDSTTYLATSSSWDASTKFKGGGIIDGAALTALEMRKKDSSTITLADLESARLIVEFIPTPRIVLPYGVSAMWIENTRVRMYDNAVLSRTTTMGQDLVLKGDAVLRLENANLGCMCSNGHSDAIV